jgi:hypothetical protein
VTLRRAFWLPWLAVLAGSANFIYWTALSRPLWVDEEMLLVNVRDRGFLRLTGPLWLDQSAPLGWLVVERALLLTLGPSEPAVRLLTIAFGIAMLITAGWIGRRWMSPIGATVLVVLCAIGQWPVFFTLELKHYSADMFGSLLIPALAAAAIERASGPDAIGKRVAGWWIAAALAQWFSNGALFVTPLCALVLLVFVARTGDRRASIAALAGGCVWLLSFAVNYALVLRHASANAYLKNYWAFAFPPTSEGASATLAWFGDQFGRFAVKPGSTGLPQLFWLAWLAGVIFVAVFTSGRRHGLMIATVPFAAIGLALLHVLPPFERLALWVVPSIYAGIGYSADAAVALFTIRPVRMRAIRIAAAAAIAAVTFAVSRDIVARGVYELQVRPRSNYGLDDRSSIRFLLANHRPGDAVLTTHFGLAGLWWYAGLRPPDEGEQARLADGSPVFEIGHVPPDVGCGEGRTLDTALRGRARAAIYLAFRMNVEPPGFDRLVLREARRRWALDTFKPYAEASRVAIFDLARAPSDAELVPGAEPDTAPPLEGCVEVRPARRW